MKFVLRVLGTWFLGLAVILLVIDGTRTLGANALVMTPLGDTWRELHPDSMAIAMRNISQAWEPLLVPAELLLSWPGWAVCGVFGILFALAGRGRSARRYVETSY